MMEIYASTRVLIYFKLFSAKLSRQAVKFSNSRRRLRPSDLCSHVSTSTTTELTEAILRTCYIPCTPFQRFRMSGCVCVSLHVILLWLFVVCFSTCFLCFFTFIVCMTSVTDWLPSSHSEKLHLLFQRFRMFGSQTLAVSLPCSHLYTTNSSLAVLVCSFFTFILCMSPVWPKCAI